MARISAPRLCGCSLLLFIAQSYTRQLRSPKISFSSGEIAPRSLKFKRGSNSWHYTFTLWPVCLLFEIFYKLHISTNDLWCRLTLEGTRESVWTCACPRLMESGMGMELERNGTIALAFGLKPALRSNYISHTPLCSPALVGCQSCFTCRLFQYWQDEVDTVQHMSEDVGQETKCMSFEENNPPSYC